MGSNHGSDCLLKESSEPLPDEQPHIRQPEYTPRDWSGRCDTIQRVAPHAALFQAAYAQELALAYLPGRLELVEFSCKR